MLDRLKGETLPGSLTISATNNSTLIAR